MAKVILDKSKCVGCGYCVSVASDTFEFDDEGLSTVVNDEVTEDAKVAANGCPFAAIEIVDDNEKTA